MANATYDLKWEDAMAELNEQLHLEDNTLGAENVPAPTEATLQEAIQHWSFLYIKYVQIFRDLEDCYDSIVHPQKRIDIKLILELVTARMLELKSLLIKWNPPHQSLVCSGCDGPFPWEYVNLDDLLVDLKLPPKTLEVPVPRYFLEEMEEVQDARDRLVSALVSMKLGDDANIVLESDRVEGEKKPYLDLEIDEAIQIIQRNERGRQGVQKALLMKSIHEDERERHKLQAQPEPDMDTETAASNIQKIFRGFKYRRDALKEREKELEFIGMRPKPRHGPGGENSSENVKILKELEEARNRRKYEQKENAEGYSQALIDLHGNVLDEEGPDIREEMMDERRAWFTDELGKGNFPEDLGEFYLLKNPPVEEEKKEAEPDKKGKGGDKKKGKGEEEEDQKEKLPALRGPTDFTKTLGTLVDRYEGVWLDRDENENFQQKHDVELAKNVVRPNIMEEVRENVDKMLVLQLQNLKTQLEAAASGGKKKGKKGKGKKGKKGKKKGKGKKGKALPGEKLCAGMSNEQMLSILIENGIVAKTNPIEIKDVIGDFNYIGTAYAAHSELKDPWGNWIPQNPSIPQVRQALTESVIIPLGSQFTRMKAPYSKSALLYGPKGCGKTMLAQAVANHTNALFLDISASTLTGKFDEGKTGPTKLMHMVFKVARSPEFSPAVIYMDEIDQIFVGKKKGAGGDAARFRKDFVTYANSLKPEEMVAIIGCTSKPYDIPDGEHKDIKNVFEKQYYVPYPDYASRMMLWEHFLRKTCDTYSMDPPDLDLSTLAEISEGYSPYSISVAIKKVLTQRRVNKMSKTPVGEMEFLSKLCACPATYKEENDKYRSFTAAITGLEARRDTVKSILNGGGDPGKSGKDGKKKKK